MSNHHLRLVYDGECPVCRNYSQAMRIRDSVGKLELIDARTDSESLREVTQAGLDIDEGMVLIMGTQHYYGAEALHALASISSRSNFSNKLNYWIFKSKYRSKTLYPVLRFCRNLLTRVLGKSKINNLHRPSDNQL